MTTTGHKQEANFARQTARRLANTVWAFATSDVGGRALALGGLLLLFLLAINALNVVNSYVGRDFMTAIEQRDPRAFTVEAILYLGVFALLTIAAVLYRFFEERLGLLWRESLTTRMVDFYLGERLYYQMTASESLPNPDQRIADDVRAFTTSTLSFALIFLNALFTIIAFSGVLWTISRFLFFVAVVYAALGSVLALVFGRSLVRLNYNQSDREADFRAALVHVRQNAELIATQNREPHLGVRMHKHIAALTGNFQRIIAVNRNLGFFTTGYNYLLQIIPILIVAPLFIRGEAEFGVISQSSMAFAHLLGAFSLVVNQFPQLSSYAAVLARLSIFAEAAESARQPGAGIEIVEDEKRFAFENLTLQSAQDGKSLLQGLSLELAPGARILVRVQSHVIATALQRAVAGIWESGSGKIVRPPLDHVFLLADRPYLPPGTLRELLVGIDQPSAVWDEKIRAALETTDMVVAVERVGGLDVEHDWGSSFSLEEQRLIGVARLLLASPRFAVVASFDEGIGPERAARVLEALTRCGVGCLALDQHGIPGIRFDAVTEIGTDGSWRRSETTED